MRLRAIMKGMEDQIRKFDPENRLDLGKQRVYVVFYHDESDGSYGDLNNIDFEVQQPNDISVYYLRPQAVPKFHQLRQITTMNSQAALAAVATLAYYCNGRMISKPSILALPERIDAKLARGAGQHKCSCPIRDLMARGCTCGGI